MSEKTLKRLSLLTVAAVAVLLMTGCGTFRRMNLPAASDRASVDANDYGIKQVRPKSYAVYPFKQTSFNDDAAIRARRAVAGSFALLGEMKSITEIDKVASAVRTPEDAIRTARQLGAEAVVLGEVLSEDHFWALMVSGTWAEMRVTVYNTANGKVLWSGTKAARHYNIDPFIGFSVVDNVYRKRIVDNLYHQIAADMAKSINPAVYNNALPKVDVK